MNLANKLTILRMLLIPFFLIFMAIKDMPFGKIIAIAIFVLASVTDKLDGYIARSRNQITKFGKFMDPLADKLLVTAALVSLVEYHIIPTWVAMIIIAREFAVTGLRAIAAAEGNVIAASPWGKAKTVTQIVAIILALVNLNYNHVSLGILKSFLSHPHLILNWVTDISMAVAIIMTLISGIDYFVKNKEVLRPDR
ncbi:CDP-diacylglycerol--glycerol-3-phosphate 3-phosphatidyltransferase [Clostridium luticellarii]|jgi:CDP-diacylglycerol--glycerol-3-phosphate 3-phosphatidyltransferase|uniref:CDP-diacylglycerol--glycerol-3-phosphate 3-phosphatidyltransferase n=1 Tax=Clostridium luticellarii TaxID=1691940 RepID=A0A2T0BHG7_9CLOT|nr:CDP-diacylglycerol--glycerol-3-phosphate 3-phosphatidyltransferase [Clostridium luticellarii]MCI1943933.1 CDP-diacylglycerol--glycerol-3-phosphate 3-phosphatidyltransferase [Clostridium luticellarii]MCI1967194.1 CDP-diacylglycerol--glycerol-3-phosphate 3-phosphatidyltransferase [Clostridium luticellarii]MCI1995925.1 CDP-diacylglycerol--glycerol-3-phosphate 3-phosphatidyltransferase [Clostridium luticellarii]MCI2038486.1 CDP-diacylglycerol--glycerol-3-phosphate 3-phosphatidyltransferase [Clos